MIVEIFPMSTSDSTLTWMRIIQENNHKLFLKLQEKRTLIMVLLLLLLQKIIYLVCKTLKSPNTPCKLALSSGLCQVCRLSLVLFSIYLEKVLCNTFQHHHFSESIREGWKPLSNLFLTGDNDLMVGRRNKLQGLTEKKLATSASAGVNENSEDKSKIIVETTRSSKLKVRMKVLQLFFFFYFFFFVADLMFLLFLAFQECFVSQPLQLA